MSSPERKLAERLRKYASGAMVEGADLSRAAAYLDALVRERDNAREALEKIAAEFSAFPIKDGLAFRCESIARNVLQ
jgi:hypothetical protein